MLKLGTSCEDCDSLRVDREKCVIFDIHSDKMTRRVII